MSGYEEFQRIMAEINYRKQMEENKNKFSSFPPGFEELFKGFRK